jgi:glutamate-1-semialdehyde 2,1-aminomutase
MLVDRTRLNALLEQEEKVYLQQHPKSYALYQKSKECMLGGVPMHWMVRSAGKFPIYVAKGKGSHFEDVDGIKYLDLCLGDTGAMTGHAPEAAVKAISKQVEKGVTFMLPSEDSVWVGAELQRRFGLKYWQFALTATDANRFSIRLARHITRRSKILVFNYCYHGTVDETFITLDTGKPASRAGNIGPPVDPTVTTKVIEWNDVAALEEALKDEDVACVLAEPVMTNIGIIHPIPGYHDKLRELTRKYGTLLIIDETHTICTGPGGYTKEFKLQPDIFVLGKPIAGGVPVAVYGFSDETAKRLDGRIKDDESDTGGIGGTLAGNVLSMAAMRATLENVLTEEAFKHMIALGERFEEGVLSVIKKHNLPWIVKRLGCRVEYWFRPSPPMNGGEAIAACDGDLDRFMHLAAINRGILMTPFHNMALMSPATTQADVDFHTKVFNENVELLLGKRTVSKFIVGKKSKL